MCLISWIHLQYTRNAGTKTCKNKDAVLFLKLNLYYPEQLRHQNLRYNQNVQRKPPSLTTLSNILTFDIARSKYSAASSNDSLEQRICPMATKALTSSGSFSIAILLQTKVLVRLLVYPVKFRGKITEDDNFASTKESTLLCHLNKGRALS